jgi:hypothetical protein
MSVSVTRLKTKVVISFVLNTKFTYRVIGQFDRRSSENFLKTFHRNDVEKVRLHSTTNYEVITGESESLSIIIESQLTGEYNFSKI